MFTSGQARLRRGSVHRTAIAMLLSLVVLGLLTASMFDWSRLSGGGKTAGESDEPLTVYCAASNRSVFEAIREDYEREYGVRLQVQYGPSQTLMAAFEVSNVGDLYLPADDSYLDIARRKNLLDEEFPLAVMQAVAATPKGNPLQIGKLADLQRSDVRLAQASIEASAIGALTRQVLESRGQWQALHDATDVFKTTVNEVANDVKVGSVDAGIVFDAVLHDYDTLQAVPIPELADIQGRVAVGVLKCTVQPRRALHFARYLSARDRGLQRYREFGFQPAEGDVWSDTPEITLYAGSMLRPAIEETIKDFEAREGVKVTRVYNGCGILVAQMQAGSTPDAYFACDLEFMNQVRSLFPQSDDISRNELVIMVQKGNPHGIRSLHDLSKPGLRVGIGHEKQCAMGWLTQRTFDEGGVTEDVMKNVAVQTPTGDMLVNQMRTGSLDAAVAYLSNAAGAGDELEAIRIHGLACAVATQPFGIAKDTDNPRLVGRLERAILAETSKSLFSAEGFTWISDEERERAAARRTQLRPASAPGGTVDSTASAASATASKARDAEPSEPKSAQPKTIEPDAQRAPEACPLEMES